MLIEENVNQVELIKKRMKEAQNRQKLYMDLGLRPLEFEIRDHAFLKKSPNRGMMRFSKFDKLSLRDMGPFEILR